MRVICCLEMDDGGIDQGVVWEKVCRFKIDAIFLFFFFLGPHLWQMDVPRLGV